MTTTHGWDTAYGSVQTGTIGRSLFSPSGDSCPTHRGIHYTPSTFEGGGVSMIESMANPVRGEGKA